MLRRVVSAPILAVVILFPPKRRGNEFYIPERIDNISKDIILAKDVCVGFTVSKYNVGYSHASTGAV